jgi:hypothetical protein
MPKAGRLGRLDVGDVMTDSLGYGFAYGPSRKRTYSEMDDEKTIDGGREKESEK